MRKLKLRKEHILALVLVATLVCGSAFVYHANAAGRINQSTSDIIVQVPSEVVEDIVKENGAKLSGNVYLIENMSDTGALTSNNVTASKITNDVSAETMQSLIAEADAAVSSSKVTPIALTFDDTGKASLTGVTNGLYLVKLDPVNSPSTAYTFSEMLILAPSNNYYTYTVDKTDNSVKTSTTNDDTWNHNVNVTAKYSMEQRKGSIAINKTLSKFYNVSGQPTTCIFKVVATLNGENVLDDVYSIDFKEAESRQLIINDIPATANVTVSEIYSGATYTAKSEAQTVTVVADETANTSFTNEYDETYDTGAISITNQFKLGEDGKYSCNKVEGDSSSTKVTVKTEVVDNDTNNATEEVSDNGQ